MIWLTSQITEGKATGPDELPAEALKALDEHNIEIITSLCNIIYNSGMIPTEMKHSVFITLPKKPKAMICTEFRTISSMSHVTKLLLKLIKQRMANKIDKEVSRLQSGFRPGSQFRPTGPPFTSLPTEEEKHDKVPCLRAQARKRTHFSRMTVRRSSH